MTAFPWQSLAHSEIVDLENAGLYIAKGLTALKDSPNILAFVNHVPILGQFAERLIGLIPVVGEIESVLSVIDFVAEDWTAIAAFGAVVHFAPADGDALAALALEKTRDIP